MELPKSDLISWLSFPVENTILVYPLGFDISTIVEMVAAKKDIIVISDFPERYTNPDFPVYDNKDIKIPEDVEMIFIDSNFPDVEWIRKLGRYPFTFLVTYGMTDSVLREIQKLFAIGKYGIFEIDEEYDIKYSAPIEVKMMKEQERDYEATSNSTYLDFYKGESPKLERLLELTEKGKNLIYAKFVDEDEFNILLSKIPKSGEESIEADVEKFNKGKLKNLVLWEVIIQHLRNVDKIILFDPPSNEIYQRLLFLCSDPDTYKGAIIKLYPLVSVSSTGRETSDQQGINFLREARHAVTVAYNYLVDVSSSIKHTGTRYTVVIKASPMRR